MIMTIYILSMDNVEEEVVWPVINKLFEDNPLSLVSHHLDSYNDFFNKGLSQLLKEKNPIRLMKQQNPDTKEFRLKSDLYLGGKQGDKVYYGKPVIYDDDLEN